MSKLKESSNSRLQTPRLQNQRSMPHCAAEQITKEEWSKLDLPTLIWWRRSRLNKNRATSTKTQLTMKTLPKTPRKLRSTWETGRKKERRGLRRMSRERLFWWETCTPSLVLMTWKHCPKKKTSRGHTDSWLLIIIRTSLVRNWVKLRSKLGSLFRMLMRPYLIQLKRDAMTLHYLLMIVFPLKRTLMMQTFLKSFLRSSRETHFFPKREMDLNLEIIQPILMTYTNSTSFGTILSPGENFLSMTNTTPMMHLIGMKEGTWKKRIKNWETSMSKKKDSEFKNWQTLHTS